MEQLIEQMSKLVKKYTKHYIEDFTTDKNIIKKIYNSGLTDENRLMFWIVRKCGTNIGYVKDIPDSATYSYYLSDVEKDQKHRYYILDLKMQTVKKIKEPHIYLAECKKKYQKTV